MIDTIVITDHDHDQGTVTLSGPNYHREYGHIPPGMLSDLPWLLSEATVTCRGATVATVVIPHTDQLTEGIGGWHVAGGDLDSGWYQLTRHSGPIEGPTRLHLCVLDRLQAGRNRLFRAGWASPKIAEHLRLYRDLVGVAWYATAGVSGCQLVRQLPAPWPAPRWNLPDQIPDEIPGSLDLRWESDVPDHHPGMVLHRWDVRAAYLAAAAQVMLPTGPLDWHNPDDIPAGWHLIDSTPIPEGPPVLDQAPGCGGGCPPGDGFWVTSPTLAYLRELGFTPQVIRSYGSTRRARALRPWAEQIRDARYTLAGQKADESMPELWDAVKGTYSEGIGMMGRQGGRLYRPDWRSLIIDQARVSLLRKIHKVRSVTGVWPVRVDVDSVWYPDGPWHDAVDQILTGARWENGRLITVPYIGRLRYEGRDDRHAPALIVADSDQSEGADQ